MKLAKLISWSTLVVFMMLCPRLKSYGQDPITLVIKEGVKKAIRAIDLKIQRLQNQTIWLQNAQKTIENAMSKLKLAEIRDWAEKQRDLYAGYFDELKKVKAALSYYQRVRGIIDKQKRIVSDYHAAWNLLRQDSNFTPDEISYMESVYSGMLSETLQNVGELMLVINAFTTQMSDAARLTIINKVSDDITRISMDLSEFTNQNKMLSLQRAAEKGEIEMVKKLYGLQ